LKLPCISVADCTGFQHAWKIYLQCHPHMNLALISRKWWKA
jgi:hypothetical protein